jgi:hypothetical protein
MDLFENQDRGNSFVHRGGFPQPHIPPRDVFALQRSVEFADVDADGDLDQVGAVTTNFGPGGLAWNENVNGRGDLAGHLITPDFSNSAIAQAAVDIDGDGDVDVAALHDGSGDLIWYRNDSESLRPGDFDANGAVGAADIDALWDAIRAANNDPRFDLNADDRLNTVDVDYLLSTILGTGYGDANLDGRFNSADLVAIFQIGQYEDDVVANSTWETGDWNGDGEFDTSDLVLAFQAGRYSAT